MKKIAVLFLILTLTFAQAYAKNTITMNGHIDSNFSAKYYPKEIKYKTKRKITLPNEITIPQRSVITAEIYTAQKELRWHKSGFFICKLVSYRPETEENSIDISDKEIYLIGRKYEKIDKKEAAITGTEIVLTQAASLFAPGVDVLYFFTKGAIQRKKDSNWFKAGVSNAYENSVCWFWLKGKPIELNQGDEIRLKSIKKNKIPKIQTKVAKRNEKLARKETQLEFKRQQKAIKKHELDKIPENVVLDEISKYVLVINPDDLEILE